ncbi:tetratricopeptide repeat protein [Longimicrobium sp.]|jgi:tetratricopeptide (TPR) repeat protein|uniref:tetratricopeptide repeat protein n=1 Tax=Longimicrobium sp. TaxID=2029185 RepID=UPI002F923DF2
MTKRVLARQGRRWCIPPAILSDPDETLEGVAILRELPNEHGLLLWKALRDVLLWAAVEPGHRAGLFVADAAGLRLAQLQAVPMDGQVELALTALTAVVASPESVSAESVTLACQGISRWAQERQLLGTSLLFAQAAALASPEQARPGYEVGSLALRMDRPARAETWLRRTIGVARRGKDWETYALAYIDLGALYGGRGKLEAARGYYVRAIRTTRRKGHLPARGAALHGLFLLEMELGKLEQAEAHARKALRAYGAGHPRLPDLLHDTARLWLALERPNRAATMLKKQLPGRAEGRERAVTLGLLARAAAGSGARPQYEEAWSAAWMIVDYDLSGTHASALLELARAAARQQDWPRMQQASRLYGLQPRTAAPARNVQQLSELLRLARQPG